MASKFYLSFLLLRFVDLEFQLQKVCFVLVLKCKKVTDAIENGEEKGMGSRQGDIEDIWEEMC